MIEERISKFNTLLQQNNIEAIFIVNKSNIRYLSGYTGDDAFLFITPQFRALITDSRYTEQAARECPLYQIIDHRQPERSLISLIEEFCESAQVKSLAFERNHISYALFETLNTALADKIKLRPVENITEQLRYVKSSEEIELMRQACTATDRAFKQICQYIKPGVTEKDIARELLYAILCQGCDSSFPIIVASGINGSLPHAIPSDKKIADHEFITMDFGCCYQGYHADMTRTVIVGEADSKQRQIYNIVLEAKQAAEAVIKDGLPCKQADAAARDLITYHGYGDNFGHGLGHGVGLDIHENPSLNRGSKQTLASGCLVTVEPGIYLPGWGGIRIEDTVLVTDTGYERLFSSPLELISL